MFTKIWWVHTLFTKKDEKKEKKKVRGREGGIEASGGFSGSELTGEGAKEQQEAPFGCLFCPGWPVLLLLLSDLVRLVWLTRMSSPLWLIEEFRWQHKCSQCSCVSGL